MICTACGSENNKGSDRCFDCGGPLPPSCSSCGRSVDPGRLLCRACSQQLPLETGLELDEDLADLEVDPDQPGEEPGTRKSFGGMTVVEPIRALDEDEESENVFGSVDGLAVAPAPGDPGPSGRTDVSRMALPRLPTEEEAPAFVLRAKLVGRADEVRRLKTELRRSIDQHELRVVTLTGPPGVGKTRLAVEFTQLLRSEARLIASSAGGASPPPYAAIARLIADRFGLADGDPPRVARQKVQDGVAELLSPHQVAEVSHLLAQLVGHPFPQSPVVTPLADNPGQLEIRIFVAVKRLLEADAARTPLVLMADEINRAAPDTVNFFHYLCDSLRGSPILILAIGRSDLYEHYPQFAEGDYPHERMALGPLPADAEALLLRELCSRVEGPLPEEMVALAGARARGNPRTLEEVVRVFVETDILDISRPRWRVDAARIRPARVPETYEGMLKLRLRSLGGQDRRVLELASVIGASFWFDALVMLHRAELLRDGEAAPKPEAMVAAGNRYGRRLREALDRLSARGLIAAGPTSTLPGEREYRFTPATLRGIVYSSLDDDVRRRSHRMMGRWIELRAGRAANDLAAVAEHYELGRDGPSAAVRYARAADQARARFQNQKATLLYEKALGCLSSEEMTLRLDICHDLSGVLAMVGEYEKALGVLGDMLRLSWTLVSRSKGGAAFNKMGRIHREQGDLASALTFVNHGLELFREAGDTRGISGSLDDLGRVHLLAGRYGDALAAGTEALEQRRRLGDDRAIAVSLSNVGEIQRARGFFREAQTCHEEALNLRRKLGDRAGEAQSLVHLGSVLRDRGELRKAVALWQEGLHLGEQIGYYSLQAQLRNQLGEAAAELGDQERARAMLNEAIAQSREVGDKRLLAEATRNLGRAELKANEVIKAREVCGRALSLAEEAGGKDLVGRALVALGESMSGPLFSDSPARRSETTMAEGYFRRGIKLLEELGNTAELARGLSSYGYYLLERGDTSRGKRKLERAQGLFARLEMKEAENLSRTLADL